MSTLKYRIVTNWPASMSEDFAFEPTQDRNAHYDLCVEILACIGDEKHPENFRITEEAIYEYEVVRPEQPMLPRMPFPTESLEGDTAFMDLCRSYTFTDDARFAKAAAVDRAIRVTVTESFVLEGERLASLAQLAKRDRTEAKFRFILAVYGVQEHEMRPVDAAAEQQPTDVAEGQPDQDADAQPDQVADVQPEQAAEPKAGRRKSGSGKKACKGKRKENSKGERKRKDKNAKKSKPKKKRKKP